MTKTAIIRVRAKPGRKREAENAFEEIGLLVSEACELFCREDIARRRLRPVERIPNKETRAAVRRVRAGEGLVEYGSFEDFRKDMEA